LPGGVPAGCGTGRVRYRPGAVPHSAQGTLHLQLMGTIYQVGFGMSRQRISLAFFASAFLWVSGSVLAQFLQPGTNPAATNNPRQPSVAPSGPFALPGAGASAPAGPVLPPSPMGPGSGSGVSGRGQSPLGGFPPPGTPFGNQSRGSAGRFPEAPVAGESAGQPPPALACGMASAPADAGTNQPATDLRNDFQRFVEQSTGRALPVFGMASFLHSSFSPVLGAQVPDSYLIGPGDELTLQIYGAVDFSDQLVVGRDGRISIPKVGPIKVAGLRFSDLEGHIQRRIAEVYRNFRLSVGMGRLRSIEIYVVGHAQLPGRKVVSSLSTLINALFESCGPSPHGSLRAIELRRSGRVVSRIDMYDFIARGDTSADRPLEPGDVIFIPPVGPQVALAGSVSIPAIYELPPAGGKIRSLLELSGGLPALAAPQRAQLERLDPARDPARFVQTLTLDPSGLETILRAGDVLHVQQVSPRFANAVTLTGSVAAPLRYTFRPGMRVSDLVTDNNFLVPVSYWLRLNTGFGLRGMDQAEVKLGYATVQRFDPRMLRTVTIPFHLGKALRGHASENLPLEPGDVVRIYAESEEPREAFDSVELQGSFMPSPQRISWREGYRLTDALPDLDDLWRMLERKRRDLPRQALDDTEELAVAGSYRRRQGMTEGIPGVPQVFVPNENTSPPGFPRTATQGSRDDRPDPGRQIMPARNGSDNARADEDQQAVRRREAILSRQAEQARNRDIAEGSLRSGRVADASAANLRTRDDQGLEELNLEYASIQRLDPESLKLVFLGFNLQKALAGDPVHNINLRAGDRIQLYTRREIGVPIAQRTRIVRLSGEVQTPGVYQVQAGERLTDIIQRAGGPTSKAYIPGTSLVRESTRLEQQRNLDRLLLTLEADLSSQAAAVSQNLAQSDAAAAQAIIAAQRQTLERLRSVRSTGRIALDVDPALANAALPEVELEDGDEISIPVASDFVGVFGAVDISNSLLFRPRRKVQDYLDQAGVRRSADLDNIIILRADGSIRTTRTVQQQRSLFSLRNADLYDQTIYPGESILVPEQIDRRTPYVRFIAGAKDWTQLIYQFGLGAAAFKVLRQ